MPNPSVGRAPLTHQVLTLHQAIRRCGGLLKTALVSGATVLLVASCGGGSDDASEGVTYSHDVQPIFNRRCTTCHRPGGPSGVDIRNPFSFEAPPNVGLARAQTQWKVRNPSLAIPELDVKAGDPNDSFLIYKISDPSSGLLPIDPDGTSGPELPPAGSHMPLQVPVLSADEVRLIEDWVFAGAPNGDFMDRGDRLVPTMRPPQMHNFAADVQPIFGVEDNVNEQHGVCSPGAGPCAHCVYCHYQGTLNPPNLSDPFGPDGIVNVRATLRPDLARVAPGDPEGSLLIHKIRPDQPVEQYGPRMPYSYAVLSPDQVDLVRQWIEQGARP
jgi:hypothetical protein